MTLFFTSDTHFGHENIIRLSKRPFANVEEMNETLIEKWNSVVQKNDTVYFLGDFSMKLSRQDASKILKRLNGTKHIILGNHDSPDIDGWATVQRDLFMNLNGQRIHLYHYPITEWNGYFKGSYHFHGHCHGNLPAGEQTVVKNRFDVSCDTNHYTPWAYDDIVTHLKNQT